MKIIIIALITIVAAAGGFFLQQNLTTEEVETKSHTSRPTASVVGCRGGTSLGRRREGRRGTGQSRCRIDRRQHSEYAMRL